MVRAADSDTVDTAVSGGRMVVRAANGDTSDTKASGGASVASSVGIVPVTGAGEVANVGSCDATKGGVRYIASGHYRNGFPARAQFVCMGGLSAAGREPTADTSPATAEGIISAGYLRVAGCVALVVSAGVADVRGAEYSQGARGVLLPRLEFGILLMCPAALVSRVLLLELVSAPLSLHVGRVSCLQPGVSLLQVVLFLQLLPT